MIVRVNVVLNRTVADIDWRFNKVAGVIQNQNELYHISCITSVDGIKLWFLLNTAGQSYSTDLM